MKFGRGSDGRLRGRGPGHESKYLLAGLARCAACSGTIHARSRSHGRHRVKHYGCKAYHDRGTKICANGSVIGMEETDSAVIQSLEQVISNDAVVKRAVELVKARLSAAQPTTGASRSALETEYSRNDAQIRNLVGFLAQGNHSTSVAQELRLLEARQLALETQLKAAEAHQRLQLRDDLDADIVARISDWRGLLGGNVKATRLLLGRLLQGPLVMTALPGKSGYRFDGNIKLDELLAIGGAVSVASPRGTDRFFLSELRRSLRKAA